MFNDRIMDYRKIPEVTIKELEKMNDKYLYVIGDPHIGHKAMVLYARKDEYADKGNTVEEKVEYMNQDIIRKWNSVIPPKAKVLCVGDVACDDYQDLEKLKKVTLQLNGFKTLLLGNHDHHSDNRHFFVEAGFNSVEKELPTGKYVINNLVFSHYPIGEEVPAGQVNIHGHVHQGASAWNYSWDKSRINVCWEVFGGVLRINMETGEMLKIKW